MVTLLHELGGFGVALRSAMSELEAHLPAAALSDRDLHTGLFQTSVSRQLLSTTLPDLRNQLVVAREALPDLRHQLVIARETQQHLVGVVDDLKLSLAREITRSGELLVAETQATSQRVAAEAVRDIATHEADQLRCRQNHLATHLGVHARAVPDTVVRLTDRVERLEDLFQRQFDAGHIPRPPGTGDDGQPWGWQAALGMYLTGYEPPPASAAVAVVPPPGLDAPVAGPRTVLQVSPAPGSGGESRPVGLAELESDEVMLGLFSRGLIAQLQLLASLLPTTLSTVIGTRDFNPGNLTVLRDIVLGGTNLPQGLTFHDAPAPRSTASASLGAPPGDDVDMEAEAAVVVSQECEDQLLLVDPSPSTSGASDTDQ
jgi:hypothetical protein